jgi:hypothetical protein
MASNPLKAKNYLSGEKKNKKMAKMVAHDQT